MTENGICIDGCLTKVGEDLIFEYDDAAMMKPWRVRTAASERIALLFEPEFERVSESGSRPSPMLAGHQEATVEGGFLFACGWYTVAGGAAVNAPMATLVNPVM